jgi:hypothetical protein
VQDPDCLIGQLTSVHPFDVELLFHLILDGSFAWHVVVIFPHCGLTMRVSVAPSRSSVGLRFPECVSNW